jgi:hypothetical protein
MILLGLRAASPNTQQVDILKNRKAFICQLLSCLSTGPVLKYSGMIEYIQGVNIAKNRRTTSCVKKR